MAVIFATSSTVITSRQWTKTVVSHGPVKMTEAQFKGFWDTWWWLFVKGYHVLEYVLLTALLLRALRRRMLPALAVALAFAASDEFHQTFVPGRGGKISDVAIDCIGITLAAAGGLWIQRRLSVRSRNESGPLPPN